MNGVLDRIDIGPAVDSGSMCEACGDNPAVYSVTYEIVNSPDLKHITMRACLQCLADAQTQAMLGQGVTADGWEVKYISHTQL